MKVEIEKIVYLEHIYHSWKIFGRHFKHSSEKDAVTDPWWVLSIVEVRQVFT